MRNISTSAWATDSSFVLPFWPKKEDQQLDPKLNSTYGNWKAGTTVLQASFECQNMTISQSIVRKPYEILDTHPSLQKGIQPMVVFNISSADGCDYELSLHAVGSQLSYGGMLWSDTSVLHEISTTHRLQPGYHPAPEKVGPMSPFARVNITEQCRNREIIIANTAWTKPWLFDGMQYLQGLPENATYEQRPNFRMRALLCDTRYSMVERSMSASISSTETVLENAPGVQGELKKIPENMFNTTRFRESSLHDNWRSYVLRSRYDPHVDQSNDTIESRNAEFTGLSAVLGAFYSYNLSNVIDEPRLIETAAKIRGRIFAETMQDIVTTASAVSRETMEGLVANVENRVVVITEVGVTIAVLFFTSFILLLLVLWFSRLARRPLNLQSDPASTVGMAALLDPGRARTSTLRTMHKASKNDLYSALRRDKYSTFGSALLSEGPVTGAFFLSLILIAILILNAFSEQSRLSQLAFIYEADVSKFDLSFKTFAPISIVPTVVSVIIGLWWDQLDQSFRILQPYIAQSQSPTPIHSGAGLTYRSKTWMGAAIKALRHRHFVLFTICLGSTLCQVLTVSMSALFERKPDIVSEQVPINRTLELRQIPIITDITSRNDSVGFEPRSIMDGFFKDFNGNFLDGATVEVMTNASKPTWSHNEWSFIPVDLSVIPDMDPARRPGDTANKGTVFSPTNVTVNTPAIRARLECSVIEEMADQNSWLATYKDLKTRERNQSITLLKKSYGIKSSFFQELKSSDSDSESMNTSRDFEFGCCANGTEGNFGMATIAYWSVFNSTREGLFGGQDSDWPVTFIPKWIRGKGRLWNDEDSGDVDVFVFEEAPRMQAARCSPIIETAAAAVTVEKQSKAVESYRILNSPVPADSAWMEVFGRHQPTPMTRSYSDGFGSSITTSYGVLFFLALFSLVEPARSVFYQPDSFRIVDREFGMNMDYISYAMFLLAGKDQDALLNYDTLVDSANRTLQTYFQHYVANKLSLQDGGFAYQKIGDNSMDSLPPAVDDTWTVEQPEKVYPSLNTNRGGIALVTSRFQILHMNSVATYLSAAILIWLIGTSVVVAALQRRYTRYMLRNVDSIADVLVLVAGSENFLSLVQQRGLTLRRDRDIKTKLGWFKGKDGEVRWGVEIVGGPDAVEWVDSPANAAAIAKKPNFVRRTTGGLIKVVTRGKTSKTNVATSP
ncbi:hypothetical protein BU24DRAFT_401289 [Aaosphaeria arxii CBS 175.79]|uniref:Uncharacterized protein n=1 Tax=Aaosphaeria arxii CBS 175.79 TaxID=1450172 RepID=A0A6A5X9T7_9PLEO|nr:uncharacterized protein BU24DRAFT_401289 [Aaosphaeria arxii CBS 175.79]KAF2009514.1 hypothetical protein BU24DRAFT_401289 [Aaosphaeria arxii CBS 175.79]